ncbi:MAG: ribosome biogenesis protein [Thaumarchaeota archaeon]|nr:ribosome biogenesis protein [Nitrososphaerota archaeon]
MFLSFVLVESALEVVPEQVRGHPSVRNDARRRGVDASRILLDRSLHHSAMLRIKDPEKRGRPDLVHTTILSVTGTPLYLDGRVRLFVHTYPDIVLEIAERTRIPKSYFRFQSLVEGLLSGEKDQGLVRAKPSGMKELIRKTIRPDVAIGLSVQGKPVELSDLGKRLASHKTPCVIIGGFPHGHFSPDVLGVLDDLVRVNPAPLEAHVVAARVIYEVERALN